MVLSCVGLVIPAVGETNPIIIENQLPGSGGWQIPWGSEGGDVLGEIKGYASATSINQGESITFHVSVNPAQTYTIEVYRLGWYMGAGGRLVQTIGPLNGTQQPAATTDPVTGLIECNWAPSYTLSTTTNWTTGVYLALLKNAQGKQNYISFVVRDDSRVGALLYQQSVTTYQAYNDYPYDNLTGKSLYAFNSFGANTVGGSKAAVKVSFNRPYAGDGDNFVWGRCVLGVELAFIRWMEKSGYDVTYSTDIDTHVNSARLLTCRGLISPGHDEYWTKEMVNGVYAARDAGVNLGFFSANMIYTQIRLEPSASGTPNRVMVCYRDAALDPHPDPTRKTVNWREAPVNRPEQALIGVQFASIVRENSSGILASYVVSNASHWVYGGTGITNGSTVTGLVGYEADRLFSEYAQPDAVPGTYTLLSLSPFAGSNNPDVSHSSIYQAASGAWVFAAGTINWSFGLDAYNPGGLSLEDVRIQKVTENILGRFLGILETNFSLIVTPPTQTIIPGASADFQVLISPTGGFADTVSLTVSGAPAGVTAELETNVVTAATVLHVTTAPETPSGTYPLTIVGVSGAISHTNTATLVVAIPDFTIGASPSNRSVVVGNSTTYTVTINPSGGFASPVALGVSGLPGNTSFSFAPNPATATATLTVTTTSSTPLGNHLLTVSGISGALTRTATVNLSVSSGVTVTAPNTAVGWQVATKKNITYTHSLGTGRPIRIEVSRDSGATWSLITNMNTTAATSGTYSWTVTGPPTSQARVKVSSTTNSFITDVSDVDFSITNPVVTVTSPNTLVSWRVGDTKNITFSHSLGTGQIVNIELSRDGGATWSAVGTLTTTSSTSGTFPWLVTAPPTTQARIRVTWAGDPTVSDISNVNFTILPRTTVTSPNTAVSWAAGTIRNVTWSHNLGVGGLVNIDFSPDNGATWVPLAANVASSAATTGTNAVRMPTNVTAEALIRVSPVVDLALGDVSDAPFNLVAPTITVTAPNTAVTWTAGGSRNITWSHNLGTAETVKIELARDGVNYSETISASAANTATTTGTFAWVVTGPATTTARVRITSTVNGAVTDISNVNFRIN